MSAPAPAYAQHAPPGPETHQLAPMAPQNTYMQPQPVPEKYPQQYPQQQPLPQEYDKAGAGAGVAPGPVMAQQPNVYNTATPLHALQRGPTPVDCPVCGQREMTRVEPHSGNTTQ
jgi:lipopolysaccharide-induced tumor necrosis factor-alpha factor